MASSHVGLSIYFFPHPSILGLSVFGGPMKGGTVLELHGWGFNVSRHFNSTPAVRFHCLADPDNSFLELLRNGRILSVFYDLIDAPVSNPNVVVATILLEYTLRCTTPPVQCNGRFEVSVALDGFVFHSDAPALDGSPALQFEFYFSPTLDRLHPLGGPIMGNSSITVSGQGFNAYNESPLCRFGPGTYKRWKSYWPKSRRIASPGESHQRRAFRLPITTTNGAKLCPGLCLFKRSLDLILNLSD
jgi:hypothetical protein